MAQPITLFEDFTGGQGGVASDYFTYAEDLDSNFTTIRQAFNQLVQEVTGQQAQNALLPLDILQINDPNTTLTPNDPDQGVIGEHSYFVSIDPGDNAQLLVEAGQAVVNNRRVVQGSQVTLVGTGQPSGTIWVALDANGSPSLETAAGAQTFDLASVNFNGTIFTGSVTQLAPIFFDGDDYGHQLERPARGTGPVFPAKDFRSAHARWGALERGLSGETTDDEGGALNPFELVALIAALGGSAGTPWLRLETDADTGPFWPFGDTFSIAAGGVEGLRIREGQVTGGIAQVLASATGDVNEPDFSFIGDEDSGIWRPGANRVGVSTSGTQVMEWTAEGHIDSATQPRADFRVATPQSVATGTGLTPFTFDTEVTDIGAWGAVSTATLTVPSGADGFYAITGGAFFDESTSGGTPNAGDRELAITLNGAGTRLLSGMGVQRSPAAGSGDTHRSVTAMIALAASDVLRLEVSQDSGGNMNVTGRLSVVKLW